MKVLVVSCSPWREDNSIGNSYTNIFKGIENIEIAHICCGSGVPNTDFVKHHFHINEKSIIKNLINKKNKTGNILINKDNFEEKNSKEKSLFKFMRIYRFQIFFLIRDIIWSFKNWISKELKEFVDDFNPDIIFAPFLDSKYLNEMLLFLEEYTKKPLIVYAWDDVYTLKQFSISPFYWINKFYQRKKLKEVADKSSKMYTISKMQQNEYAEIFGKDCDLLYKGYSFTKLPKYNLCNNKPLKLVFTGNIAHSRWKILAQIGEALRDINKEEIKAQLFIYTNSPTNNKIEKSLNIENSTFLMGEVSNSQVLKIQQDADILVHVEPFEKKELLRVKMSFSTKLVDYFMNARCIFAVGSKDVASIEYLTRNDAAIVSSNKDEIYKNLQNLIQRPELIKQYSEKAWECGRRNHQINKIQKDLYETLRFFVDKEVEN